MRSNRLLITIENSCIIIIQCISTLSTNNTTHPNSFSLQSATQIEIEIEAKFNENKMNKHWVQHANSLQTIVKNTHLCAHF